MIVTVTMNPAFDKVLTVPKLVPGSLNRVRCGPLVPSGKGINVARVIHAWNYPVTAVALAGEGFERFGSFLTDCGVEHRLINVPGEIRTNIKLIEEQSGVMTELNEPGPVIGEAAIGKLKSELMRHCYQAEVVVLSGSLPPGVPAEFYEDLTRELNGYGVRVVVDASGPAMRHALKGSLFAIKPNRVEAQEILGAKDQPDTLLMQQLQELGACHAILSLGSQGAYFAYGDHTLWAIPPRVRVANPAGAGDTLLATYLVGVLSGWSFRDCVARATAAAAATVRDLGGGVAGPADVRDFVDRVRIESMKQGS